MLPLGDVLDGDERLGLSLDIKPGRGEQESEVLGFAGYREGQARFHLVMAETGFQGIDDGKAYRASLTVRAKPAAFRVI